MTKESKILIAIVVVAAVLRLWNLELPDMNADDAAYSYRAVDYVDFLAAVDYQSTPATWFDKAVWWQKLSFHDAPPFVFLVQHISFKVLGINQFAARIPFVIAGLLAVYGAYLLARELKGERVGLLAAGLIAISNYPLWLSRVGFLDGFLIPIILFAIYFFIKAKERPRYYLAWGALCGAGVLTKYTFLFMLPVFLILSLKEGTRLKNRNFWLGIVIFILLITPLIIYNFEMYQARGHFDAAISTMIGEKPQDFIGLTREKEFDALSVFRQLWRDKPFTPIIILLALVGIVYLPSLPLVLGLSLALLELFVVGSFGWMGAILVPFIVIFAAVGAERTWRYTRIILPVIVIFELLITLQNSVLPNSIVESSLFETEFRAQWQGYSEMENFVRRFYEKNDGISNVVTYPEFPQLASYQRQDFAQKIEGLPVEKIGQKHLLVFDERTNWFATLWTIERRRFYDRAPIHLVGEFIEQSRELTDYSFYTELGFTDATAIIASDAVAGRNVARLKNVTAFADLLRDEAPLIETLYSPRGEPAFFVYEFSLAKE